jgi:hypothetical protein
MLSFFSFSMLVMLANDSILLTNVDILKGSFISFFMLLRFF